MSSRDHECPKCGKEWNCGGCETSDVLRECDTCLEIMRTILDPHHKQVFDQLVDSVQEQLETKAYIRHYFDSFGCHVNFSSGEVKDKATGSLRAYLGAWKKEGDRVTLDVQLVQKLEFITCNIVVDGSKEVT